MIEKWRPVLGFEELYAVSDHGRVKRIGKSTGRKINATRIGHILSPSNHTNGYKCAHLYRESKCYARLVHRLVFEAFVGKIPKGYEINHIDGNKINNFPINLECVTSSENTRHAIRLGLSKPGPKHGLKPRQLEEIRQLCQSNDLFYREIAAKFGVSKSFVWKIYRNTTETVLR